MDSLSSMIRTLVRVHREIAFLFRLIFFARSSAGSRARPTPPKECNVVPLMLQAAIPVEAVTATASGDFECLDRSVRMISRSRTDLPVPIVR